MNQFETFPKIEHIGKLQMTITEKLDGTNAQILIYPDDNGSGALQLRAGSRNRFLAPGNDHFGFAEFVIASVLNLCRYSPIAILTLHD